MGQEREFMADGSRAPMSGKGALFLLVKEMAKIIISRSGTNSLLKFAVSCSNFPVGELRKEKRIQSWSLEIKTTN